MRRGMLLVVGVACLVGLGLLARMERRGASVEVVPAPAPVRDVASPPSDQAPLRFPVDAAAPRIERATEAPATRAEEAESFAVHIQLRDAASDEPVPDVTVLVAPSGTRPRGTYVGRDRRAVTDLTGSVFLRDLDARGPWDVYASPYHPTATRATIRRNRRVGTLTAVPWRSGERPDARVLAMRLGARVVLRSPLPAGVAARDVLFELRGTASPLSSQIGGLGAFARGEASEDGFVVARFHPLSNVVRSPGMTIHAVTEDGLFGLTVRRDGEVDRSAVIEIDEPFEPRGNVRFEVVIDDPRREPPTAPLIAEAARKVRLGNAFFTDPDRLIPAQAVLIGRRVHVEGSIFEFRGLPLETVEIGQVLEVLLDPDDLGDREPASGEAAQFEAATTLRVQPVHGTTAPVRVRVNRLR